MGTADIKNTVTDMAAKAIKASGEFAKTAKIRLSIASEEANLNAMYTEVGKKVREIYDYGGSLGAVFDEKYRAMREQSEKIDALKEQVNTIKGVRECPFCGKSVPKEADFCPKCGKSAVSVDYSNPAFFAQTEEPVREQQQSESPQFSTCRVCGKQSPRGEKFCLSCGRLL
ncbi:hypothetical protein FACS189490_05340 [Clostridia bacterium]|nr:hypothetical protein FACS189490_05340 [Clostridia bacterium]